MTMVRTRFASGVAAFAALAVVALAAPRSVGAASAARPYDLNGDGRREVVLGAPFWDVPGAHDVGAVVVLPGTPTGVGLRETVLLQPPPGAAPGTGDWGSSVVSADFDRDGFADLAVGTPFDPLESTSTPDGDSTKGSVTIFSGSASGLARAFQTRILHGQHMGFGASLAPADFDSDGWVDLAVGSIFDTPRVNQDFGSGAIVVLNGGPTGFSLDRSQTITRPNPADAVFGLVLAAGDVNRDGHPDLVESFAGANKFVDNDPEPGRTTYIPGTAAGLQAARRIGGRAAALAVGDVTGDGYADIVAGNRFGSPSLRILPFRPVG